jgi:hypothetical protein
MSIENGDPTEEIRRYEGIWGQMGDLLTAVEQHLLPPAHSAIDSEARFSLAFNHLLRHSVILKFYVEQRGRRRIGDSIFASHGATFTKVRQLRKRTLTAGWWPLRRLQRN